MSRRAGADRGVDAVWYGVFEADFSHHTATACPPALLSCGFLRIQRFRALLTLSVWCRVWFRVPINVERAYDLVAQEQVRVTPPSLLSPS